MFDTGIVPYVIRPVQFCDPQPVIILDDCLSAVDTHTETAILDDLRGESTATVFPELGALLRETPVTADAGSA